MLLAGYASLSLPEAGYKWRIVKPWQRGGCTRDLGAEKDKVNGQIKVDTIVKALEEKMNHRTSGDPATVLATNPGTPVL